MAYQLFKVNFLKIRIYPSYRSFWERFGGRRHNTQTNTEGAGVLVLAACPVEGGGIGGRELWCSFGRAAGEAQRKYSTPASEYNSVALRHLN
jgi:hypothetical protein